MKVCGLDFLENACTLMRARVYVSTRSNREFVPQLKNQQGLPKIKPSLIKASPNLPLLRAGLIVGTRSGLEVPPLWMELPGATPGGG